jgi:hypothetical protein
MGIAPGQGSIGDLKIAQGAVRICRKEMIPCCTIVIEQATFCSLSCPVFGLLGVECEPLEQLVRHLHLRHPRLRGSGTLHGLTAHCTQMLDVRLGMITSSLDRT